VKESIGTASRGRSDVAVRGGGEHPTFHGLTKPQRLFSTEAFDLFDVDTSGSDSHVTSSLVFASYEDFITLTVGRHSDSLRESGDRIPVGARFFAAVHTGPGAHPASCTMCTGVIPGGKAAGAWS
jgi:hypothetical protein